MTTDELPRTGPIAAFAATARALPRSAHDPRQPWVLVGNDRVLKVYDLRAFDAIDRGRALIEAETAVALRDLEGVVTTYDTQQVDGWLTIEMERLGETLTERLASIDAGVASMLPAIRWGELLEEAALALGRVHRHRIVHRDVKPSNLMFDRSGLHLFVADFSIASRGGRGSGSKAEAKVAGTRRYIAPEVFKGRIGYAADQYGLAVTAEEILGDEATASVREVLLRATEQEPEDRFPAIEDFGVALRTAIDDRTPYRLTTRLRRISPSWRSTWGTGAIAAAACYALLIFLRIRGLSWIGGLLIPFLAAGASMLTLRMVAFARNKRSTPRMALADRPWVPIVVFIALMLVLRPLYADQPSNLGQYALYSWLGAIALVATLGSIPHTAGEWLIRLTQRWERWRHDRVKTGRQRLGLLAAIVAGLALVSALPAAIGDRWPSERGAPVATSAAPVVTVAASRAALLGSKPQKACAFIHVPADRNLVSCRRWAPVAARWLRHDLSRRAGPAFRSGELGGLRMTHVAATSQGESDFWEIWTDDGNRNYLALLEQTDEARSVWDVEVTRNPPTPDPTSFQAAYWGYELVRQADGWRISGIEICDFGTQDQCVRPTAVKAGDWSDTVRQGAPERHSDRPSAAG